MISVGENQILETSVTMPDNYSGFTLSLVFNARNSASTIVGSTQTGATKGETIFFTTDLESKGISPDKYDVELYYDDNGVKRQILTTGDDKILVKDAESI
jgi:hypothetical protein